MGIEAKKIKLANRVKQSYVSQHGMPKLFTCTSECMPLGCLLTKNPGKIKTSLVLKYDSIWSIVEHTEVPRTKQTHSVLAVQNPCAMLWTTTRDRRVFNIKCN